MPNSYGPQKLPSGTFMPETTHILSVSVFTWYMPL